MQAVELKKPNDHVLQHDLKMIRKVSVEAGKSDFSKNQCTLSVISDIQSAES